MSTKCCLPNSHSFGYDCTRRQNLQVLDSRTLVYATGDLLHFLCPDDGSLWCQPSTRGRGISCIAVRNKSSVPSFTSLFWFYICPEKKGVHD